ncbi:ParA family protein [Nakamurella sp. PAMC28650]|uniref:ParA family protein n=1 Tax=Nakamurella sp. PAMC28650 TaxID=2762325 RepID=UPI00164CF436|nr:ParA family protein [Nakamurella sp. PAMC28650]QNK82862.1 ParA family protein [Nakamurella sp. PAMC28650]
MGSTAIDNLKGGVGKTTVTLNLSVAVLKRLRKKNRRARVRIIDMDPQAFATAVLTGSTPRTIKSTVATMLAGLTTPEATFIRLEELDTLDEQAQQAWAGIDLLPSNPEAKLTVGGASDYWGLRETLEDYPGDDVGWTFFDCGYGQTDSFFLAMVAADGVLGVTSASEGAMFGLVELRLQLSQLHKSFGHVQDLTGVVANNFDLRRGPDKAILADLKTQLGKQLWEPVLPSRVAVERAHGARLPLAALAEDGAKEMTEYYDQLAKKLIATEAS